MRARPIVAAPLCAALVLSAVPASPCTSILVTRGATADGSTMITYAADSHALYGELYMTPAGVHGAGRPARRHRVGHRQAPGQHPAGAGHLPGVGNMNEHQVAIGETTFGGRKELEGPAGIVDYGSLICIALERAKTAREAIRIMAGLVDEHGYASTGESFSIADPNEVWLLEMIGKGKGQKGAVWVALRVPDGYLTAHANQARIRSFPLADPANALYAKDVISFAREKGWFAGKDEEFSFADTYAPLDFGALRFCEARVWSIFRRAAPSLRLPVDMIRGDVKAERLPLWIKPDRKLAVADVMALMRDHFEGTELDMTKDVGAGPFALPYRWRPMTWKVDGGEVPPRARHLDPADRLLAGRRSRAPGCRTRSAASSGSASTTPPAPSTCRCTWACARAAQPGRRRRRLQPLQLGLGVLGLQLRRQLRLLALQRHDRRRAARAGRARGALPRRAGARSRRPRSTCTRRAPGLARDYLTEYSVRAADETVARWRQLGEHLVWKYLDGNVRDAQGNVTHPTYPDTWYRRIVGDHGEVVKQLPAKE